MDESTECLISNSQRMREKLQLFFMDPLEKFRKRSQIPIKLLIQVLKILLVTAEMCLFAGHLHPHIGFMNNHVTAFRHLLLEDWDPSREITAYPPPLGPMAIYETTAFHSTIDYAVTRYSNLNVSVGHYEALPDPGLQICLTHRGWKQKPQVNCYDLNHHLDTFSSAAYLGPKIRFKFLTKAVLSFSLETSTARFDGLYSAPNCYNFTIGLEFDNEDLDGQMLMSLNAQHRQMNCSDGSESSRYHFDHGLETTLDVIIIILCLSSLMLCTRSLVRAQKLKRQTNSFFLSQFGHELCPGDQSKFLNWWYVTIIVNDLLLVVGTALKLRIESAGYDSEVWTPCVLFLGVGEMLVWFGFVRYLSFFRNYNIVILTLQKAAPQVFKFLLGALLIFAGFTFSGWLIFAPYHLKFQTLLAASECLFSLMNGDDMFATFAMMSRDSTVLWVFSKIYLYIFICLYVYVILSTFISVIDGAYGTIAVYYIEGFPKGELQAFMEDTEDVVDQPGAVACRQVLTAILRDVWSKRNGTPKEKP